MKPLLQHWKKEPPHVKSKPSHVAGLPPVPSRWPPSKKKPTDVYLVEKGRFDGTLSEFAIGHNTYVSVAAGKGWKRELLATAITGNPADFLVIWKVPASYPEPGPPTANPSVDQLKATSAFFDRISHVERIPFAPLPYDPGTKRPRLTKPQTIIFDRITVRDGAMPLVVEVKKRFFVPTIEKKCNWDLFSAGYEISDTGAASTIIQCWKAEAQELIQGMIVMAHEETYMKYLAPNILHEDQQLYSVTSTAD